MKQCDLVQVDRCIWEIPQTYRADMRVPARVIADEAMLPSLFTDDCLTQLVNTTTLPGVVRFTVAAPDIHSGYGAPVGGISAIDASDPNGVISPGVTGYDINCGVRLLTSQMHTDEIMPHLDSLLQTMYKMCPSGTGDNSRFTLSQRELERILADGTQGLDGLDSRFVQPGDVAHTESEGKLPNADPTHVSRRACERGYHQLGTLGAGNHFLEIGRVAEIPNTPEARAAAEAFGLWEGQVTVFIHCGSRGLGHQVATDYIKEHQQAVKKYQIELPDRQLVCAPLHSPEGQAYLAAMACAANFAFANRQVLTSLMREVFAQVFRKQRVTPELNLCYDLAHNIAKEEQHTVGGKQKRLIIHRKGATRAFGPNHPDVPAVYRSVGQPVLLPGSMGTSSYVLVGAERAMEQSFGSCAHGAGRVRSRSAMRKQVKGEHVRQTLKKQGVLVRSGSTKGLSEEAPEAYKDIHTVVRTVEQAGLARIVARLEPLAVVKG
jgi:tRNA-splicing ligase RtcB